VKLRRWGPCQHSDRFAFSLRSSQCDPSNSHNFAKIFCAAANDIFQFRISISNLHFFNDFAFSAFLCESPRLSFFVLFGLRAPLRRAFFAG
jgi:hypothetical protein